MDELIARLRLYADQVEIADEKESEFSRDMRVVAQLLENLTTIYSPGHRWTDRDGKEHWFVQNGEIAPGYVGQYLDEGGEVIARQVGPWQEVHRDKED